MEKLPVSKWRDVDIEKYREIDYALMIKEKLI